MEVDSIKARIAELSFKKMSAGGLTPAEEAEMAQLRQQLAMQSMTRK